MRARYRDVMIGGAAFIALTVSASGTPESDVPVPLRQAGDCMLGVLKSDPGVSHARLGITHDGGWAHIFLEYEAEEKTRWEGPTRFNVQKPTDLDHGPYFFVAVMPGIVGPEGFDFHVTNRIVKKWHEQCGVSATVLTV